MCHSRVPLTPSGATIASAPPPPPQINGNVFRASRLYNEDVDILLQDKMPMLQAIFDHYKALALGGNDK